MSFLEAISENATLASAIIGADYCQPVNFISPGSLESCVLIHCQQTHEDREMLYVKYLLLGLILIFSPIKLFATEIHSPQDNSVKEIKLGDSFERALAGGETHRYQLKLTAGRFVQLTVEQLVIDVVFTLIAPDGKRVVEMDSPNGPAGLEALSWVTTADGMYHVEVSSPDPESAAGRYHLKFVTLRAAAPNDAKAVSAQALFLEAKNFIAQGTGESLRKAVAKAEEALPLWREVGDRLKEAYTLNFIGTSYDMLGEHQKGVQLYFTVLEISRAIGERNLESDTLGNIGGEYYSLGEYQKALDYYNQSLALGRTLGNDLNLAPALNNLALLYDSMGDARRALEYYNEALVLVRKTGNKRGVGIMLSNIGMTYAALGENETALEFHRQSLEVKKAIKDRWGESFTLSNIGVILESQSDYEAALDHYKRALDLSREIDNKRGVSVALNNIGGIHNRLAEGQKALEYLNQALPIMEATGDKNAAARTLNNIGQSHGILGDHQKALEYFNRALALAREVGDRFSEAQMLSNIGETYDTLGDKQKALEYFALALPIRKQIEDRRGEALTLNYLGSTATSLGQNQKGLEHYQQALALSQAIKDRHLQIASLRGIARCERNLGNLAQARERIESALAMIENMRSRFASTDVRAAYFASVQEYYEFYIDLLMRLHESQPGKGFGEAALEASERARARNLLDLLAEARIDVREGVAPALLQRARSLQERLNSKAERQTQLLNRKHTDDQAKVFQKEIDDLLAQYKEVEVQIRTSSPRYAALTQPRPLLANEIQQRVLDPDTVLLEYSLGSERSYLWVVTSASLKTFVLPSRAEIQESARTVYELLTARNRRIRFETAAERRQRIARADADYRRAASALSRMILQPALAELGHKRMIVVSDGALNYIPFAALPKPRPRGFTPLIVEHEIVNLPSASTLDIMRSDTARARTPEKTLVVIADPVFEKDDERVRRIRPASLSNAPKTADKSREVLLRSMKEFIDDDEAGPIKRLPFTRTEADEILALVPGSQAKRAIDFDASRSTATSPDLAQYRFVHFATHGLINSRHPELSGIVLSLVNEKGEDQNGFLRANEIFNLKLPADMVVLSGCRTGLGKEIRGEGLLGLTRGFMYAGASRVLVSLWSVSDQASADLMAQVYKRMLGKPQLRPAAALREAQIAAWRDKRWQAPYYWAAFVLQGEPR